MTRNTTPKTDAATLTSSWNHAAWFTWKSTKRWREVLKIRTSVVATTGRKRPAVKMPTMAPSTCAAAAWVRSCGESASPRARLSCMAERKKPIEGL